jgi:hypothetical protein
MNKAMKEYNDLVTKTDDKAIEIEDNIYTFFDATNAKPNGKSIKDPVEETKARTMIKDLMTTVTAKFDKYQEYLQAKEYFNMLKSLVDDKETERKTAAAAKLAATKATNETERKAKDATLKTDKAALDAWKATEKTLKAAKSAADKNPNATAGEKAAAATAIITHNGKKAALEAKVTAA